MLPIYKNLYQFTTYISPLDFTIHQYLLATDPAILFATGTAASAKVNLPKIKEILGEQKLQYIFISHLESDECGGLAVFHEAYPEVKVICSRLGARELPGYDYQGALIAVDEHEKISDGELSLRIFDYPAEVHLQNGIVGYEENSGIFYSSDLMFRYGNGEGKIIQGKWSEEVGAIDHTRVSQEQLLKKMQSALLTITPQLIAVGHGFCVECRE